MLSQRCSVLGGPRDIAWEEKGNGWMKARGHVPFEIKIMRSKLQSHISLISADGRNNERAEV